MVGRGRVTEIRAPNDRTVEMIKDLRREVVKETSDDGDGVDTTGEGTVRRDCRGRVESGDGGDRRGGGRASGGGGDMCRAGIRVREKEDTGQVEADHDLLSSGFYGYMAMEVS